MKSPDLEVNVLVSMENVTSLVSSAVQTAKSPEEHFALRRAVIAQIERDIQQKTGSLRQLYNAPTLVKELLGR